LKVLKIGVELKKHSLQCVPCTLKDDDQAVRVEMTARMLSILEPLARYARSWVLTADDSWIYFSPDDEGKLVLARDHHMTKPKALINAPKVMTLVVWGVDWTALVKIISPDLRFSAKCMCKSALPHLEASARAHRPKQGFGDIIIH
jgi:hypothetical protein